VPQEAVDGVPSTGAGRSYRRGQAGRVRSRAPGGRAGPYAFSRRGTGSGGPHSAPGCPPDHGPPDRGGCALPLRARLRARGRARAGRRASQERRRRVGDHRGQVEHSDQARAHQRCRHTDLRGAGRGRTAGEFPASAPQQPVRPSGRSLRSGGAVRLGGSHCPGGGVCAQDPGTAR